MRDHSWRRRQRSLGAVRAADPRLDGADVRHWLAQEDASVLDTGLAIVAPARARPAAPIRRAAIRCRATCSSAAAAIDATPTVAWTFDTSTHCRARTRYAAFHRDIAARVRLRIAAQPAAASTNAATSVGDI